MGDRQLPEDIVIEILSRVPVRSILRSCRLVCRRWKDLTSTLYFSNMQKKRSSIPMILVEEKTTRKEEYCQVLADTTENRAQIKPVVVNSGYSMVSSCDGLFLLRSGLRDYMVANPITQEKVGIYIQTTSVIEPYGLFFHPLVEEYCILWWDEAPNFKILTLGPKPCWRDLYTRFSWSMGNKCTRCRYNYPVVVNGILYRGTCRGQITAFDIRREEISLVPFPGSKDQVGDVCGWVSWNGTILLDMKGQLSLVQPCYYVDHLNEFWDTHIWVLKDYTNGLWNKFYTVNMKLDLLVLDFRPVAFMNDELILQETDSTENHRFSYRLFAYNLKLGTTRNFVKTSTSGFPVALAYVPSIVSMKNWEPKILLL